MTVYLLAHGSADPRHAGDVDGIAQRLSSALGQDVHACYLDHCPPRLADVADRPGVVVPLLLSPGYHVQVDVGEAVAQAPVPLVMSAPPLLTSATPWGRALVEETAGVAPGRTPVLVTAGTRDRAVLQKWQETADALGTPIAHASGPGARLADLDLDPASSIVVPLLIARGYFSGRIIEQAAAAMLPVAALAGQSDALIRELVRGVRGAGAGLPVAVGAVL